MGAHSPGKLGEQGYAVEKIEIEHDFGVSVAGFTFTTAFSRSESMEEIHEVTAAPFPEPSLDPCYSSPSATVPIRSVSTPSGKWWSPDR
jgi:hypothetical protein